MRDRYFFHLPLLSLFHPLIVMPETIRRLFQPSISVLSQYRSSFTDGTQFRAWRSFKEAVQDGSASQLLEKMEDHLEKKQKIREEKEAKQRAEGTAKVGKEN